MTLIAGLIISQIGRWCDIPLLVDVGHLASILMGVGIGASIAYYLKAPTLVVLGCIVTGNDCRIDSQLDVAKRYP